MERAVPGCRTVPQRRGRLAQLTVAGIVAGGVACFILVASACNDGQPPDAQPTSVSPGRSPTTPSTSSPPSESPTPSPTSEAASLLYTQFGATEDTLWLAPVDPPGAPRSIITIPHAAYWGINAALSPDGTQLAYVVLPATVPDPEQGADSDGEIWLQPLDGRPATLLTSGASVRFVPIWSADGRQLVFQTFDRRSNAPALRSVNLEDGTASTLASMPGWSMLPLGFGQRGQLYLARTREGVTEIVAVSIPDGALQTPAITLGLEVYQGDLSTGGERACLVGTSSAGEWGVWVVDIGEGASTPLDPQGLAPGQEIFSAVWRPGEDTISLGTAPGTGGSGVLNVSAASGSSERLPGPERGFDVPLEWSPHGNLLAVQEFGEYPVQLRPRLRLLSLNGQRRSVAEGMEATFIGWSLQ